jgi:hypothetical protein
MVDIADKSFYEYDRIINMINEVSNKFILEKCGYFTYKKLVIDELGFIGLFRDDIYNSLLSEKDLYKNKEIEFALYIRISISAAKEDNITKELEYLERAKSIFPTNPVVLYRMAVAHEANGEGETAIRYYSQILEDKVINSSSFNKFIQEQIERVKTEGPSTRPPNPGIKYMISGM